LVNLFLDRSHYYEKYRVRGKKARKGTRKRPIFDIDK